jgi:hypothetical protein
MLWKNASSSSSVGGSNAGMGSVLGSAIGSGVNLLSAMSASSLLGGGGHNHNYAPLERTSNAYVPKIPAIKGSAGADGVDIHNSENKTKTVQEIRQERKVEIRRQIKAVLNKLAPEKFRNHCEALCKVEIKTAQELAVLVEEIFEKAVTQHNYCEMYCDMCMVLRSKYPEFPDEDEAVNDTNSFTRLLLNQCQEEF